MGLWVWVYCMGGSGCGCVCTRMGDSGYVCGVYSMYSCSHLCPVSSSWFEHVLTVSHTQTAPPGGTKQRQRDQHAPQYMTIHTQIQSNTEQYGVHTPIHERHKAYT